ncbi:MAG: hypothetical protein HZC14_00090 [Candidatus Niyogibacteria bacterium]|nr:hypothetical protein [Candidatus Niyogibacteria bacterium]
MEKKQPHISGERAVLSQKSLVLFCAEKSTGNRVVVKCSGHEDGMREIRREKIMRDHLATAKYSTDRPALPKETFFGERDNYIFLATEYVDQERVFVKHDLQQQFFMALNAFERQEAFHATTYEHLSSIKKIAEIITPELYSEKFGNFIKNANANYQNSETLSTLMQAKNLFDQNLNMVRTYSYYLIHEDLVPHNFRIRNSHIHMLDCASLQYGNKYESWARFINYMVIHSPELEKKLLQYIKNSRGEREYLCLRVMRAFKVAQLINYHASLISKVEGNFLQLTKIRLDFWTKVLSKILADEKISSEEHENYTRQRDALRSNEEKERQQEFAVA